MCMWLCACEYRWLGKTEAAHLLVLELQVTVICLTWVQEDELSPSGRATHALDFWAISPAPGYFNIKQHWIETLSLRSNIQFYKEIQHENQCEEYNYCLLLGNMECCWATNQRDIHLPEIHVVLEFVYITAFLKDTGCMGIGCELSCVFIWFVCRCMCVCV